MIVLQGPWKAGYAFDMHSIISKFTGDNQYGKPTFDTNRTEIGEYLYQLKYGQNLSFLDKIIELLIKSNEFKAFFNNMDIILPVPSSNKYRKIQPVLVCSNRIALKFNKQVISNVLSSTNKEELKNLPKDQKYDKIRSSISISKNMNKDHNILLFDDVFDSGSTLTAITDILIENEYKNIYVFTLTKTKG